MWSDFDEGLVMSDSQCDSSFGQRLILTLCAILFAGTARVRITHLMLKFGVVVDFPCRSNVACAA